MNPNPHFSKPIRGKDIALYIHIPFCPSKCHYCSFAVVTDHSFYDQYIEELKKELAQTLSLIHKQGRTIRTIYFGGGTPSTLKIQDIKEILRIAQAEKTVSPLTTERSASEAEVRGVTQAQTSNVLCSAQSIIEEISFEMNPEHVTKEYLTDLKALGITRVSIGIQSLEEKVLQKAGRKHSREQALQALSLLRDSGLPFNADLILGLPESTRESFMNTLKEILTFTPAHISSYFLTIEPGTEFQLLPKQTFLQEDEILETFEAMKELLLQHHFSQYEISNWARPGFESQHNLVYWRGFEYFGVGLGASSYFEKTRWNNVQNMKLYLSNEKKVSEKSRETLSTKDVVETYLMTSLRLLEGSDLTYIQEFLSEQEIIEVKNKLEKLCTQHLLSKKDNRYTIPEKDRLLHNFILGQLL